MSFVPSSIKVPNSMGPTGSLADREREENNKRIMEQQRQAEAMGLPNPGYYSGEIDTGRYPLVDQMRSMAYEASTGQPIESLVDSRNFRRGGTANARVGTPQPDQATIGTVGGPPLRTSPPLSRGMGRGFPSYDGTPHPVLGKIRRW